MSEFVHAESYRKGWLAAIARLGEVLDNAQFDGSDRKARETVARCIEILKVALYVKKDGDA